MIRCIALAALLSACTDDGSDDAIWRGTVMRDGGAALAFAGFDPEPEQGFEFGGGIVAVGYIADGEDKFLAEVALHFADDDFERAKSTAFPIDLAIKDVFMSSETGMGVDYFEQPASESDPGTTEQTFHHDFAQHQAGTASGTFTVTACDYDSFMDGTSRRPSWIRAAATSRASSTCRSTTRRRSRAQRTKRSSCCANTWSCANIAVTRDR